MAPAKIPNSQIFHRSPISHTPSHIAHWFYEVQVPLAVPKKPVPVIADGRIPCEHLMPYLVPSPTLNPLGNIFHHLFRPHSYG